MVVGVHAIYSIQKRGTSTNNISHRINTEILTI